MRPALPNEKQLTVAQLVAKLQELPQDLPVYYSGSEWIHECTVAEIAPMSTIHFSYKEGRCVILSDET
jgi:hypothetical protein